MKLLCLPLGCDIFIKYLPGYLGEVKGRVSGVRGSRKINVQCWGIISRDEKPER